MLFKNRNYSIKHFAMILALLGGLLGAIPVAATYAEPLVYRAAVHGATSSPCGEDWSNPCDLQYVLNTPLYQSPGAEVWVAAGTYFPGIDRTDSFELRNGVAIYGGFEGTEVAREQRDPTIHTTILSGNIGLKEVNTDNSYHVVTSYDTDSTAVLDGFTVTGGYGGSSVNGGGLYNSHGSPTLANLFFQTNSAREGGGVYTRSGSPTLTNITFMDNLAVRGGGIYNASGDPILTNVAFGYNRALPEYGGGMYNLNGNPVLVNVSFGNNSAQNGGAMFNMGSSPSLIHVTISSNSTGTGNGGGMVNTGGSHPTLTNVILWNNSNSSGIVNTSDSDTLTIRYSVVQGGCPAQSDCLNLITTDPRVGFLGTYDGDNVPTIPIWDGSSALDAADDSVCPDTDQRGAARPYGDHCDIGSYEYRPISITGTWYPSTSTSTPTFTSTPTATSTPSPTSTSIATRTPTRVGPALLYVKWNATGANNGLSWANAFTDLQVALTAASSGDEIWVAAGTYKPTTGTNRNATFQLKSGVAIYGGFLGNETLRGQRKPLTNVTILSGDLNGDDSGFTNNSENVLHVVKGATSATLDGFTITGGNANIETVAGGGMYNYYTNNLTLKNVVFVGNSAYHDGGGMYNYSSNPTLTNVTFINNAAVHGGGLYNYYNSSTQLTEVTFSGNSARDDGGGMFNYNSSPKLTNVTFTDNSADRGGGLYNAHSSPILTNVSFTGNSASSGGGLNNMFNSHPILTDVEFSNNTAEYYGAGVYNYQSNPKLTDVTFTNNTAGHSGGGMDNTSSSPILIDVTFSDNTANFGGGMKNYNASNPSLVNVTFINNSASYKGGGIANTVNSNPVLTNVTFSGNTVSSGHGGGMDNDDSDPILTNVTFKGNRASTWGGGIHNITSNPSLRNTVLWGNTAPGGAQLYNYNHAYGVNAPVIRDSVVQGGCPSATTCSNIINTDPRLGTLGNYGGSTQTIPLQPGSSAIDTGNDSFCPDTDQRGVTRPQGSHCDIGAYEYRDLTPPTVLAITRVDPEYTSAANVNFTVTFSESVTGVDASDFSLSTTGNIRGARLSSVTGLGASRIVSVQTGSGSGTLRLDVPVDAVITDLTDNLLGGLPFITGEVYRIDKSAKVNVGVFIHGQLQGTYSVSPGSSTRQSYQAMNNGPVKINNTDGISFMAAERVIYKVNHLPTSFSELMGSPANQLDNVYWLPWYNNVDLDTQLRFANVSNQEATVHILIGGQELTGSPFTLAAGASTRKSFVGINNGPVKIVSDQTLVAAERVIYKVNGTQTSFSEMMAFPESQLNTLYWLPWYNNVDLDTQLRIANVNNIPISVRVYIGGEEMDGSPFTLSARESKRLSFVGMNSGPVKMESSQPFVASERVIYKVKGINTSFSEMMALPNSQLDTEYWLPWYNNVDLDTQLRIANIYGSSATVHVYIGGVEMQGSPFTLQENESIRQSFPGINSGPVQIVSDTVVIAAARVIYKSTDGVPISFSEMMGLPNALLDSTYWFPWYNNVDLDTQLRFGVP